MAPAAPRPQISGMTLGEAKFLSTGASMASGQINDLADAIVAAVAGWRNSERRNEELATRLGELGRSGDVLNAFLGLSLGLEPPLPSDFVAALAAGLDAEVAWFDDGNRMVAAAPAGSTWDEGELLNRAATEADRVIVDECQIGRYAVAIAPAGRLEGTLLVAAGRLLSDAALTGLRRASQVMAVSRLRENALRHAYEEARSDLLTELLSLRRSLPHAVRILAQARGLPIADRYIVAAIGGRPSLARTVADVADVLGGVGGRYAGLAVAVVPGDDPQAVAGTLGERLRRITGTMPSVCASEPVELSSGGLPDAFEAAQHGLALLSAVDSARACVTTRELGLYRPLFDPDRSGDVQELLDTALRPLHDYEREHKVDLVKTVRVFLDNGGNTTRAARQLHIHPNTMSMRLERVSRLLGDGWQDGVSGLRLRLALHLSSLKVF